MTRDIAGVQSQIGGLGVDRLKAINDLALALEGQDLQRRQQQIQQNATAQQLAQQQAIADRQYQLARGY